MILKNDIFSTIRSENNLWTDKDSRSVFSPSPCEINLSVRVSERMVGGENIYIYFYKRHEIERNDKDITGSMFVNKNLFSHSHFRSHPLACSHIVKLCFWLLHLLPFIDIVKRDEKFACSLVQNHSKRYFLCSGYLGKERCNFHLPLSPFLCVSTKSINYLLRFSVQLEIECPRKSLSFLFPLFHKKKKKNKKKSREEKKLPFVNAHKIKSTFNQRMCIRFGEKGHEKGFPLGSDNTNKIVSSTHLCS
jgi:hypothetical protein